MSALELIFPEDAAGGSLDFVLSRAGESVRPFAPEVVDMLDGLSRDLFPLARTEPALAPLAFFIRRANLEALATTARARTPHNAVLVPQGTVFHIPPTNVDTLFLYTLAIALLAGNSNVVRISRNAGPATDRIIAILVRRLKQHEDVAPLVTIVRFDRDPEILDALSRACDMRMIWGGDAAVRAIRTSALAPHAKELTFPDRVSLAAIDVTAWTTATDETRTSVIEGLYNDTYWFDQMACSSPVHVMLVGGTGDESASVRQDVMARLDTVAATRYDQVDGQAINKMVDVLRGLERGLADLQWTSNAVVTLDGAQIQDAVAIRPGGGFFSTQHVAQLDDVLGQLSRRIQTLSVFGFAQESLVAFIERANGAGIDRVVPIGHALDFSAIWDGKDLLQESLRLVTVEV